MALKQPVRLIGLSVTELGPAGEGQLPLFGPDASRRERLGRALDRLVERFGEDSVGPASLLGGAGGRRRSRHGGEVPPDEEPPQGQGR